VALYFTKSVHAYFQQTKISLMFETLFSISLLRVLPMFTILTAATLSFSYSRHGRNHQR